MLENNLVNFLGRDEEIITEMKHLDNLEYKTFINKFNNAYDRTLQKEQKDLLTNYIVSFSDNGVGLKTFLNEEIGRLKNAVQQRIVEGTNDPRSENFKKVYAKLDNYKKQPLNEQIVEEIFYIQDLIAEVSKNDRQD
jgi:TRAP-type mannitol/chloroaromatic compound transport system substrate-binding protein